jgi:hypothetical protein
LQVMRDGRSVTVEVTSDGVGLVERRGGALLAAAAAKLGLTGADVAAAGRLEAASPWA